MTDSPRAADCAGYPLITMGIPVRNGEELAAGAIESALAQTYPNIEVLVSDNCSSDRTGEICRSYAVRDARVRYHRQSEDLGAGGNFEWLAQNARGKFFMWIAHDDTRAPDSAALLADALRRHPRAVIAYGDTVELRAGEAPVAVAFDCDTRGLDLRARLRKTARQQFFHIYGLWRTGELRQLRFGASAWGPDLPLLMVAACMGEVVQIGGAALHYRVNPKPYWMYRASRDDALPWGKFIQKLPVRLQPFAPRFAFSRLVLITWRNVSAAAGYRAGLYAAILTAGWLGRQIYLWIRRRTFPRIKAGAGMR